MYKHWELAATIMKSTNTVTQGGSHAHQQAHFGASSLLPRLQRKSPRAVAANPSAWSKTNYICSKFSRASMMSSLTKPSPVVPLQYISHNFSELRSFFGGRNLIDHSLTSRSGVLANATAVRCHQLHMPNRAKGGRKKERGYQRRQRRQSKWIAHITFCDAASNYWSDYGTEFFWSWTSPLQQ